MSNTDPCVQTPRSLARSYKPTADKLQSDVKGLQRTVTCLCESVNVNTEDIEENRIAIEANTTAINNIDQVSSISFTLSITESIPPIGATLITTWTPQAPTGEFSLTDVTNGVFTAPSDGVYYVSSNLSWQAVPDPTPTSRQVVIKRNIEEFTGSFNAVNNEISSSIMFIPFSASMGDTISICAEHTYTTNVDVLPNSSNWSIIKYQ